MNIPEKLDKSYGPITDEYYWSRHPPTHNACGNKERESAVNKEQDGAHSLPNCHTDKTYHSDTRLTLVE